MSGEQARRIRQLEAELVGIGKCSAAIVRDLKDAGHDEMARRFSAQVEASRWTIQQVARELDALRRIETEGIYAEHDAKFSGPDGDRWMLSDPDRKRFGHGKTISAALISFDARQCECGIRWHDGLDRCPSCGRKPLTGEQVRAELDAKAGDMRDRLARKLFGDDVVDEGAAQR